MRFIESIGLCVVSLLLQLLPAASQARSFRVEGQMRAGSGALAVGHFVVRLYRLGEIVQEKVSTDGSFAFADVPIGEYDLEIADSGFPMVFLPLNVLGNEKLDLVLPSRSERTDSSGTVSVLEYQIPPQARRHFEKAQKMIREDMCRTALVHLQEAIQLFPRYPQALNALGTCWVRMQRLDAAEEAFKNALALTSSIYPALNLADLYERQGKIDEAEKVLQNGIRHNPDAGDGYFGLAKLCFDQNRLSEAAAMGLEAHRHREHSPDVHLLLAKIRQRDGDVDAIADELQLYVLEARPGRMRDRAAKALREFRSAQGKH